MHFKNPCVHCLANRKKNYLNKIDTHLNIIHLNSNTYKVNITVRRTDFNKTGFTIAFSEKKTNY